jgi:hypothetical protein
MILRCIATDATPEGVTECEIVTRISVSVVAPRSQVLDSLDRIYTDSKHPTIKKAETDMIACRAVHLATALIKLLCSKHVFCWAQTCCIYVSEVNTGHPISAIAASSAGGDHSGEIRFAAGVQ